MLPLMTKTEEPYASQLCRLEARCPQMKVLYVPELVKPKGYFLDAVRDIGVQGYTHIVSTRMDSDDAISPSFIRTLRGNVKRSDTRVVLNFPLGCGVRCDTMTATNMSHRSSMFISMLSEVPRRNAPTIVYSGTHVQVAKNNTVRQINTLDPMWLILVHKLNVANDARMIQNRKRGTAKDVKWAQQVFKIPRLGNVCRRWR